MKLESLTGISLSALGLRFNLVNVVPTLVLLLVTLALHSSGAPTASPQVDKIVHAIHALELGEGVVLTLALLSLSLVLQPLQLPLLRLLEGYWGFGRLGALLVRCGVAFHRRRRNKLEKAQTYPGRDRPPPSIEAQMGRAAWKLRRFYPSEDRLLPTTLGNVMRAAEDMPGTRYGLDAIVVWPRLYSLLPKELTGILADERNQLDVAVRFCLVFFLTVPISAFFLWRWGWWLLVPVAGAAMAWVCYRAAIAAALAYGEGINTAFDLHRFKLLKALHLPLPADLDSEKRANKELSGFWRQGTPANFKYVHHEEKEVMNNKDH
jgi:hypothetical protein